jgi:hypothetical protein
VLALGKMALSEAMALDGEKVRVPVGRRVPSERVMGRRTLRWNVTVG